MENTFEYIVGGAGPSGVQAAQTLVEAGVMVAMLDVGEKDEKYELLVPNKDFEEIRKSESDQNRYFLGDDLDAISWGDVKVGAQLTPARKAMIRNVDKCMPLISYSFFPMESLGNDGIKEYLIGDLENSIEKLLNSYKKKK